MTKLEIKCPDCSRIIKLEIDVDSKIHTIPEEKLEQSEHAVFITEISAPIIKELKKASWIYHIFEKVQNYENTNELLMKETIENIKNEVKDFAKKDRSSKFVYFLSRVYNIKDEEYIGELYVLEPIIAIILWYISEKEGTDFISKTINYTNDVKLHLAYTKDTSICVITRIDALGYPEKVIERIKDHPEELICGMPKKLKFEVKKNFLRPIFEKKEKKDL